MNFKLEDDDEEDEGGGGGGRRKQKKKKNSKKKKKKKEDSLWPTASNPDSCVRWLAASWRAAPGRLRPPLRPPARPCTLLALPPLPAPLVDLSTPSFHLIFHQQIVLSSCLSFLFIQLLLLLLLLLLVCGAAACGARARHVPHRHRARD